MHPRTHGCAQQYSDNMARGNQRDLARAKNAKKQEDMKKSQKKGDHNKRAESDAEKMRAKQAAGT